MNMTDIPRLRPGQEVGCETKELSSTDQERLELGRKAAQLLGYHGLKADVTGQLTVDLENIGNLGKALLALDIEVLDTMSVFRYQQAELLRRNTEYFLQQLRGGNIYQMFQWGWRPAAWEHTEVNSYTEAIPEFVLNKAVQVKEKVSNVKFYVQHLNEPKADPFLVAVLDREVYFIEVWAEPRFEGRIK